MDPLEATLGDSTDTPEFRQQPCELPSRLRLLCIGVQQPSWVNLTLQLDAGGCHEPQFHWVSTSREALSVLRDQSFDCIVLNFDAISSRVVSQFELESAIDPMPLVHSIRNSGYDDPLILLTSHFDDADWADACRHDCEVVISPHHWECRSLVAVIKRAVERVDLRRDNHRLAVGNHRRLIRERDEAEHLLSQQRQILGELARLSDTVSTSDPSTPTEITHAEGTALSQSPDPPWQRFSSEIADFYHELLRAYVIMGSGGLGNEIAKVAELIAFTGLKPREAMQLHLERVEALVRGLGSRSARHVMARADLMALELMIHLGESYQKQATSTAR